MTKNVSLPLVPEFQGHSMCCRQWLPLHPPFNSSCLEGGPSQALQTPRNNKAKKHIISATLWPLVAPKYE